MKIDFAYLQFATDMSFEEIEAQKEWRRAQWIASEAGGDSWSIAILHGNPLFNQWFATLWENRLYMATVAMKDVNAIEANRVIFRQYTAVNNLNAYPTGDIYDEIVQEALKNLDKCRQEAL